MDPRAFVDQAWKKVQSSDDGAGADFDDSIPTPKLIFAYADGEIFAKQNCFFIFLRFFFFDLQRQVIVGHFLYACVPFTRIHVRTHTFSLPFPCHHHRDSG